MLNKIDNSTKNEKGPQDFHSRCHAVTSLFNDIVLITGRERSHGLGYKSQVAGIVSFESL